MAKKSFALRKPAKHESKPDAGEGEHEAEQAPEQQAADAEREAYASAVAELVDKLDGANEAYQKVREQHAAGHRAQGPDWGQLVPFFEQPAGYESGHSGFELYQKWAIGHGLVEAEAPAESKAPEGEG